MGGVLKDTLFGAGLAFPVGFGVEVGTGVSAGLEAAFATGADTATDCGAEAGESKKEKSADAHGSDVVATNEEADILLGPTNGSDELAKSAAGYVPCPFVLIGGVWDVGMNGAGVDSRPKSDGARAGERETGCESGMGILPLLSGDVVVVFSFETLSAGDRGGAERAGEDTISPQSSSSSFLMSVISVGKIGIVGAIIE